MIVRMISFYPQKIVIQKVITIALLTFFVLSSLAGATESVLCIDLDEMHILEQEHHPLVDCHAFSAISPGNKSHQTTLFNPREHQENYCVDIALSSYASATPLHNLIKKVPRKELPRFSASSYLPQLISTSKLAATCISFQIDDSNSPLMSLRTVVLLI